MFSRDDLCSTDQQLAVVLLSYRRLKPRLQVLAESSGKAEARAAREEPKTVCRTHGRVARHVQYRPPGYRHETEIAAGDGPSLDQFGFNARQDDRWRPRNRRVGHR
jgi:hypothetical protein